MKNRHGFIALICAAIVFIPIAVYFVGSAGESIPSPGETESEDSSDIDYTKYYAISVEGSRIEDALQSISKDESPYPYLYKTMKVYTEVLGYSPDRAAETASDMYYEGKAFTWYGREHGFTVSDDEVKSYINSIVSDYTNADNYEELQAACSANGTTLEEVAFDNFYTYKVQLLRDRIYEAEQENHPEFDTRESFNGYWNDFKARIVEDYKSADEFQSVQKACKNSITLINSDVGADKSVLSKHEIFIE